MFKSIGKMFKKIFGSKATKAESKDAVVKAPVVNLRDTARSNSSIGGGGYYKPTVFEICKANMIANKVSKRRKKNKSARASRNAQHKKANNKGSKVVRMQKAPQVIMLKAA